MSPTAASTADPSHAVPAAARSMMPRAGGANEQTQHASNDDPLVDEDGDDVFSNPDTAELESRSDATGATSPAPNSPGPGSPTNRVTGGHMATITSSQSDPFATLKQSEANIALPHTSFLGGVGMGNASLGGAGAKPLLLASLPQTNIAQLQQELEQQQRQRQHQARLETPKPSHFSGAPCSNSPAATPNRHSPRPAFGRALSASGATMQAMSSPMHATHSALGNRHNASTPRHAGHASSHSASHVSLPHHQLPSAHGLPTDPREASTMSKLFAHPPAQSPAEEFSGFILGGGREHSRGASLSQGYTGTPTVTSSSYSVAATPAMSGLAARRFSRPTTRPPSPERLQSPSRKTTNRASAGAMGLGLSPHITPGSADDGAVNEGDSSIFERDIEHRDATHVLSKSEAMDVAIPSVLDDAVEAIHSDNADQVEIVAPHTALPPLALSMQALSAHSSSQIKLQHQQQQQQQSEQQRSISSSPYNSPSPPLSSAGAVEPPPGSMAAQIAERLGGAAKATSTTANTLPSSMELGSVAPTRHRRPNSDVSISSGSSLRSRSPQAAPLSAGVQQVLAATNNSPRSANGSPSVGALLGEQAGSLLATSGTSRSALPTATALPALPLPNPYRMHSPSASVSPLPELHSAVPGLPMLPSLSMDGAVMPSSESATLDASFGGFADVIASQPPTSANSLANSPSMRLRGLALEEHPAYDVSPYSSRSPIIVSTTAGLAGTTPNSPLVGRGASAAAKTPARPTAADMPQEDEYALPLSMSGKKRLSFFSYADIINQTPGEVMNLDEALRQTEEAAAKNAPATASSTSSSVVGSPVHARSGVASKAPFSTSPTK